MQKYIYVQTAVLAGGTIFAWYQWYLELFKGCDTCSGAKTLISKCFLGAIFFTAAFVLNLILIFKSNYQ